MQADSISKTDVLNIPGYTVPIRSKGLRMVWCRCIYCNCGCIHPIFFLEERICIYARSRVVPGPLLTTLSVCCWEDLGCPSSGHGILGHAYVLELLLSIFHVIWPGELEQRVVEYWWKTHFQWACSNQLSVPRSTWKMNEWMILINPKKIYTELNQQ